MTWPDDDPSDGGALPGWLPGNPDPQPPSAAPDPAHDNIAPPGPIPIAVASGVMHTVKTSRPLRVWASCRNVPLTVCEEARLRGGSEWKDATYGQAGMGLGHQFRQFSGPDHAAPRASSQADLQQLDHGLRPSRQRRTARACNQLPRRSRCRRHRRRRYSPPQHASADEASHERCSATGIPGAVQRAQRSFGSVGYPFFHVLHDRSLCGWIGVSH